jgi:hypothetical protein
MTRRIFVSATSSDLGSFRTLASESLRMRGYEVDDQGIFHLTDLDILEMLEHRIQACEAVVCLVGFVCGGEPSRRAEGEPRRSYNQWEYYLARKHGKPVFVLLASESTTFDGETVEDDDLRKLQEQHRREVTRDRDWRSFANKDQLRAELAQLRFPWERPLGPTQSDARDWFGHPLQLLSWLFSDPEKFVKELSNPSYAGRWDHYAYTVAALTPWVVLTCTCFGCIVGAAIKLVFVETYRMLPAVMISDVVCLVFWTCLSILVVLMSRYRSGHEMAIAVGVAILLSVAFGVARGVPTGSPPELITGLQATLATNATLAAMFGVAFAAIVRIGETVQALRTGQKGRNLQIIFGFVVLTGLAVAGIRAGLVYASLGVNHALAVLVVYPALYMCVFALTYLVMSVEPLTWLKGLFAKK